MTRIEEAISRGEKAQSKNPKWVPLGVHYPGWLTVQVRRIDSDEVEGVYFAQGKWQFHKLGRDKEGNVRSYDVRDRELKRIAKAMIGPNAPDRDELLNECARVRRKRSEGTTKKQHGPVKRARKKKRKKGGA